MKYSAQITVSEDIDNLEKVFASEDRGFSNGRASYTLSKEKKLLVFKITAKDATALRAVLNSIAKILAVYGKAKKAIGENDDE